MTPLRELVEQALDARYTKGRLDERNRVLLAVREVLARYSYVSDGGLEIVKEVLDALGYLPTEIDQ